MKSTHTIKINFRGGIISPGDLHDILVVAERAGITNVKFGLRQQLLIQVESELFNNFKKELNQLDIFYEADTESYPNIMSSYPAEEVFITKTWLSEGVYKDIFDTIDYQPRLKINISDSNQSFTPLLTGNINWVAAPETQHFWHLFIRFPKTNSIYEWNQLVYTNDVARVSKKIESLIFQHPDQFYDNADADGNLLFSKLEQGNYITRAAELPAQLPAFNLPYYEGLNRYYDKYWLGIYRRDELFDVRFLKDVCELCLKTKIGLLCSTPWKTMMIKSIEEKDRLKWNALLAKHQINVRHAANELNFQVEDDCEEGLELKNLLLEHLHRNDTRTFGVCVGIKTRKKSEVFSSILVRRKALLTLFNVEFFYVYDILCAHDFNPNERTGFVFSRNNPRFLLADQLQRAIFSFQEHRRNAHQVIPDKHVKKEHVEKKIKIDYVHQCRHCFTVYDEKAGEPENSIAAGTGFELLPDTYSCPLCEGPKEDFNKIEKTLLGLQTI